MSRILWSVFAVLCCLPLFSQSLRTSFVRHVDAYNLSTGGNRIPYNRAERKGLSLHCLLPYQLKELCCRRLQFNIPVQSTVLDAELEQAGDPVFQETVVYLGAGKQLSGSFFLSVRGGYYHLHTAADTRYHSVFAELSCLYHPISNLIIGCYFFNPSGASIKAVPETSQLPQAFNLGCSYQPANAIKVLFEAEKQSEESLMFHGGLELRMQKKTAILLGLSGKPFIPSWGFEAEFKRFTCVIGGNLHQVLGMTSGISLYYHLK